MALVHAELTATCNSLGYAGAEKYFIDPQCAEAVRDLIKFLRRDGDDHDIRRFLGAANIVETDLLQILLTEEHERGSELFDLVVRLLVNLTTPALLIYNEQPPVDKTQRQYYLELVSHLQKYKRAFTDIAVWKIVVDKLADIIQAEYHEKGEEKVLSTVRLLILVRNILHVPADNDAECRPDNDANLHDQVLWAMHQSQLIDIIMYIVCSDNEQQYYLHALEIISLMLRDQNATELANASVNRTETEKQRDEHELKLVLEKERKEKLDKIKKYSGLRHSRFGGRFVVSGMKSIGDNEMVVSSMTSNVNKAFDRYKKPLKTPRNRMALKDAGIERKSAFSVRLFLKEFCVEFLHGSYNTLMRHVREMLVRSKSQPNDESYYFWAMQFFMEFNRNYKFEIKLVSETMALNIFHFVQERIEESREKLITDKKKIPVWSRRMHLGLKAYKELMETLLTMYGSKDPMLRSSARTILTNLFYMVEYRDMLLGLLNLYDEVKFSRMYLKDLIETNHIFMKLLEDLGKRQRNLIVQCKPKKQMKKKKNSNKSKSAAQGGPEDNDTMWTSLSSDLKEIIQMHELVVDTIEARPYDPVSDVSMDDQKVEVMCRIRILMRNKRLEEAVKLLRASREVWPEENYFGNSGLSSDEELDIFKQIFYADLAEPMGYDENVPKSNDQIENEDNGTDEEEYEESSQIRMEEANFKFIDFVKKFAKPKILQNCCLLLKEFDRNSIFTNHAVVKLLHRITYDCKFSALMFQASVFRVFQKIFLSKNPSHKELKKFAIFIMRKFTEAAKKNNKVFMELLFWKDLKVAYEIEEGYNVDEKKTTNWSEEQEDELHRLHEEYLRDMPEEDELMWICNNLIRKDRSKVSISKKIKQLGIVLIKKRKRKFVGEFSEAEIVQITQLVTEFKDTNDPISFIMDKLDVKHPKKHIITKILELGLVRDRKELRKKRLNKSNKFNGQNRSSEESDDSDSDDNDEQIDFTYHSLTSVYVLNAIKKVIDRNMKLALLWLVESLDEAADDLDVDESDIPLLPLTDECMTAINDTDFQEVMKILGIHKPSSIQETYWRIPGRWQANDIRQRSVAITNVIEGKFVVDDDRANRRLDDSSDEDVEATFDRIRKTFGRNIANCDTESANTFLKSSYSIPEEPDKENTGFSGKKAVNKRKFLLEDDNEQDKVSLVKKKLPLDNSSDDGDSDAEKNIVSIKKKILEDGQEEDKVIPGKEKPLMDDSSDEENSFMFMKTNIVSVNKKKVVLEDSDDDNISSNVQKKSPFGNSSDKENSNIKKSIVTIEKKIILKDKVVPIKTNLLLEDSSDEDNFMCMKNNFISVKKKVLLEDSDDDNISSDVQKKSLFGDSNDEKDMLDTEKSNIVSPNEAKVLSDNNDEENRIFTVVQEKWPLEDSHKGNGGSARSQMDQMSEAGETNGKKRRQRFLESSDDDSEEEIGVKKTKRFVNDDSD